jgi:uncharacterized membrane protein YfbV (UPF0208 family)
VLSAIFLGENILNEICVALVLVCSGIWWVNKRALRLCREPMAGRN